MKDDMPRHTGLDCEEPCAVCAAQKAARSNPTPIDPDMPTIDFSDVELDRLNIRTSKGAALIIDALVRHLADKPAETLRTIAALVKTLPVGLCPSVTLAPDNRHAFELLAAQEGATVEDRLQPPTRSVWVTIDGVDFGAAMAVPRTPLEQAHARIAALSGEKRQEAMRRLSRSFSVPMTCAKHDGCTIDRARSEVIWPDGERWPADPDMLAMVMP